MNDSNPFLGNTISVSVWSGVEINTGIICACLPMIRQPLSLLFPNLFSTANRSNPRAGYPLSYAAATRHKTRGDRSLPTGDPDILTWTRNRDDHSFMVSVKPGSRQDKFVRRTESEEEMIGLAPEDLNGIGAGIMKTTNVSISESLRTGYRSSSSHVGS